MTTPMILRTSFALILSAAFAGSASAAFVAPSSWTRGAGGNTYQEWDAFTTNTGATPDAASVNPNGAASLTETAGGSIVTGSDNIYNPTGPAAFEVTIPELDVPAPPHNVTAVVQIQTLGTELDYSSVMLNGLAPVDTAELSRVTLGGFGGASVESWFLFNVPYASFGNFIGPDAEDLTLTFEASGAHLSLGGLSVDTAIRPFGFFAEPNPIPEPSAALLTMLAAAAGLWVRRR